MLSSALLVRRSRMSESVLSNGRSINRPAAPTEVSEHTKMSPYLLLLPTSTHALAPRHAICIAHVAAD
jgi:hypothetical protein